MAAFSALTIGLIAAGVGGGLQAAGSIKAGRAAKKAGEQEAQLREYNAQVAELNAQDALERGVIDEGRFRAHVRGVVGSQRTGFAGQGVDVASGSALDVQLDAEYLGELDAMQIRQNAMRESWGYKVEAHSLRLGAQQAREAGKAQATAAYLGAAGSLVGTAGSLYLTKYGYDQARKRPAA